MYNRDIEIREAIEAGERALHSLRDARSSLGSARNWGLFDLLGGDLISGLVKHKKIGDARASLNQAKYDLERFSRELNDVRDLQELNIEIGDFLIFADFFFDGFLADIMVQSKIRQAQENIDDAIFRVENLLSRLRRY
ncbi:MAG: hypothetical protein IJV41_05210 [Oscillospiraceae bacterium]|nr:hypothetical protein [Oscillospiraceae bacterium]